MNTKASLRARQPLKPDNGFLGRWLDPIDRLGESIFAILIMLLFTVGFSAYLLDNRASQAASAFTMNELIITAFGAAVVWGTVDGLMYALLSMFSRGEEHRLLIRVQTASTEEEGIEAIAEHLDYVLEPIASPERRELLYADALDHLKDSHPQPVRFMREDITGALGYVLAAIIAVLPSLAPLVLLRNNDLLALLVSTMVSFSVLFYLGFQWGKYSHTNPWKTGLLVLGVGVLIVPGVILLGGK